MPVRPFHHRALMLGMIFTLLLISFQPAYAKGQFSKITIQTADSSQPIDVSDPAFLNFWTFSDFTNGTTEAPQVIGPAYEITRWLPSGDGKTFAEWDRLRYYSTSEANTDGRGWIFYEGLINGSSEYDGKWFVATRNADALMESVNFPATVVNTLQPVPTIALGSAEFVLLVTFGTLMWLIVHR